MLFQLRTAKRADQPSLARFPVRSARTRGATDYLPEQIDTALGGAYVVDRSSMTMALDYVSEADGMIIGSGGWSRRRTRFDGDLMGSATVGNYLPLLMRQRFELFRSGLCANRESGRRCSSVAKPRR